METPTSQKPTTDVIEEISPTEAQVPIAPDVPRDVLRQVMPRLWQPNPHMAPRFALEVIDGPYRGVIYDYGTFSVSDKVDAQGMRPVKFNTVILASPKGFKTDVGFDRWSADILIAWLGHTSVANYDMLIRARTRGIQ